MEKVTGIGGVFFRAADPKQTYAWYRDNLGIDANDWGKSFAWTEKDTGAEGMTQWSAFEDKTEYFGPGKAEFMINYRVTDLDAMLAQLEANGVKRVGQIQDEAFGKFAHVMDPDGRKIELWQPPATLPADE